MTLLMTLFCGISLLQTFQRLPSWSDLLQQLPCSGTAIGDASDIAAERSTTEYPTAANVFDDRFMPHGSDAGIDGPAGVINQGAVIRQGAAAAQRGSCPDSSPSMALRSPVMTSSHGGSAAGSRHSPPNQMMQVRVSDGASRHSRSANLLMGLHAC
jgi:hypothetical protein